MRILFLSTLAFAAIVLGAPAANAQFTGATVNYQYFYPNLSTPYSGAANGDYVVGPGVEISDVAAGHATMDISNTNIFIDFLDQTTWTAATYNGWILSDTTNNLAAILGVTIDPATNMAGFSLSNVSFTADSISVNWSGLSFDQNTVVSLNVAFANAPSVPEPSTWAMMMLAFGACGVALRRRPRKVLETA